MIVNMEIWSLSKNVVTIIFIKLLSEVKLEKELLPVGREISGVVLEGKVA